MVTICTIPAFKVLQFRNYSKSPKPYVLYYILFVNVQTVQGGVQKS